MLQQGKSEPEILEFMTARYGDFVLYRPPVKSSTYLLWYGPMTMAVLGIAILLWVLRRRNRMPSEHFDPDIPEPDADTDLRKP
jgi:cytochrome c-type biogenesis protein CcmH